MSSYANYHSEESKFDIIDLVHKFSYNYTTNTIILLICFFSLLKCLINIFNYYYANYLCYNRNREGNILYQESLEIDNPSHLVINDTEIDDIEINDIEINDTEISVNNNYIVNYEQEKSNEHDINDGLPRYNEIYPNKYYTHNN
jgi:hypothetical protein